MHCYGCSLYLLDQNYTELIENTINTNLLDTKKDIFDITNSDNYGVIGDTPVYVQNVNINKSDYRGIKFKDYNIKSEHSISNSLLNHSFLHSKLHDHTLVK